MAVTEPTASLRAAAGFGPEGSEPSHVECSSDGVIGGLVLAAGAGRRYGGPKQLARLEGKPLLEHSVAAMRAAPLDRVAVVLGAEAERIRGEVHLAGTEIVLCREWEAGQSASLRAGLAALADADAVVIVLGDQPRLSPRAVERLLDARGTALAIRATYDGVPAHPVLVERPLFARLSALQGDEGARSVLRSEDVLEVPCDGLGRPDDVDTPAQLDALD